MKKTPKIDEIFKNIWDIKANLAKLITLITLKMYINKILYLLSFICFLFHVNMFLKFLSDDI